jgi:hypothetical protein
MSIIRQGFESADLDVPVVLPTLNLDFANSQSLDNRITFSRGSIGTRVNRNGLIETIPANQPRFDFDPISGECRGLLIEESRTNLITSSNGFGGDTTDYGITSGITSPDGTSNASLMYEKTNNGYHFLTLTPTFVVSTTYCASIFCKYAGSKYRFRLKFADGLGAQNNIIIDLRNGSIISGSGVSNSYGVIKYPNGWYRVYTTLTATSTSGFLQPFLLRDSDGSSTYQGDGTSGIYIWGAQLEAGAFPTSYIPTVASTVTRSADNASITGTNFSSWFGSGSPSELSAFYSGLAPYASINGAYYWQLTNTAITERILYRYAGLPQIIPYINGLSMGGVFANPSQNVNIKSVGLIDNKSFAIRANDGNPDYQFTNNLKLPRIPTGLTQLNIGSSHSGFNYLNGTIRKLAFYPKRISSNQAVYLTQ